MAETYYIRRDGKISGPHSLEALKVAAKSQRLLPDDLIATSKAGPWKKLKLGSDVEKSHSPRPTSDARAPRSADDDEEGWTDEPADLPEHVEDEGVGEEDLESLLESPEFSATRKFVFINEYRCFWSRNRLK